MAEEDISAAVSCEMIGSARSLNAFDVAQRIAVAIGIRGAAGGKVNGDSGASEIIVYVGFQHFVPKIGDDIEAAAAIDDVIARRAGEVFVIAAAGDGVVIDAALDTLYAAERIRIAKDIRHRARAGTGERGGDARGGGCPVMIVGIDDFVKAATTIDDVVTTQPGEYLQVVTERIAARQVIVLRRRHDIFDIG